ncbi:hypothetical protein F4777DRAFT_4555 [Nemania sp. FL0916]|nr:hypothetical protein F4777DRAFT_4555 [Nemania sp. FL0916]
MAMAFLTPKYSLWALWGFLIMVSQAAPQVSQLYQFTYPTAIQDLLSLSNGCLLLSTSTSADVYYIDPEATFPAAQKVITLPGSTALTGFATLGDGLYAVAGSKQSSSLARDNSDNSDVHIYVVKVETAGDVKVTLHQTVAIPGTTSMDGMAALPEHPKTILSADSIRGRVIRVNTDDSSVSVAFEHPALKPGKGANKSARGIKGLKIRDGHLYFTNSAQKTFGRFPIDAKGTNTGDVEILAHLDDTPDEAVSYDDFSFDNKGNAFVAVHPSSIRMIAPDGKQSVLIGGKNSTLLEPTSVAVSSKVGSVYVSTAGRDTGFPVSGGQVLKVRSEN